MSQAFGKAAMRAAGLAARARIAPDVAAPFADRLAKLGPEFARAHGARSVSAYWPISGEIATDALVRALHAAGFPVGLPVTGKLGTPLTFRRWSPEVALIEGRMKILEPPADAEIVSPDLLFVPLVAFDRRGHRIGYGAGFYDRTLAALRADKDIVAVGIAYAEQEVLFIPADPHDEVLDFVVTEKDTIVFADAG